MLHEPDENEWLFMNVYPYEIEMTNINANNSDNLGAAGILYFTRYFSKVKFKVRSQNSAFKKE